MNFLLRLFRSISIKQKLLLLFSFQIIIPLIFMGTMLYRNTERIIQDKSITYSLDILKMIELRMNDFADNMVSVSEDLLNDATIHELLEIKEDQPRNDYYYSMRNRITNTLKRICLSRNEIQSIAVISKYGTYYTYDLNSGRANIEEVIPYQAMLNKAREADGSPIWYLDKDIKGNITNIYLARTINSIDDFEEMGMVAILIKKEFLRTVYGDLSTSFMQNIDILSQDNEWIIGTNPRFRRQSSNEVVYLTDKKRDYQIDKVHNILLSYIKVDSCDWKIVTEISLDELNSDLNQFKIWFVIIALCTVLVLSIFSILVAIDIIEPINRLVSGIKKVQEQNVYEEVIVDRKDELGYLSKCFNKMSKDIDTLLNRVYKEELTRKEAELKALQAQINPHFLFNTLESINWMAQLNNVPEIRDMVTSLASLIEASIGKGNPLVSLSQELKYVDSYVLIMKTRYGDRLLYESDIDIDLVKSKVPKLLLQPLIENAIYHGIDKKRQQGQIKLTIKKDDNNVHIEIMDNGKGMTEEEVIELNKRFKDNSDDYLLKKSRRGIGLENVNRRIKLFFGNQYGLSIESKYEHYTKVHLIIPKND